MTRKKRKHHGSTLDAFLKDEGVLEKFEAIATKEVIAWQFAQAMKKRGLSKSEMAQLMKTSRTQLDRLLDPKSGNVTLTTLMRAASALGKAISIQLR